MKTKECKHEYKYMSTYTKDTIENGRAYAIRIVSMRCIHCGDIKRVKSTRAIGREVQSSARGFW